MQLSLNLQYVGKLIYQSFFAKTLSQLKRLSLIQDSLIIQTETLESQFVLPV